MSVNIFSPVRRLVDWLADRPSYILLVRSDEALAAQPRQRFAYAWVGLMILSLLVGIISCQIWGGGWKLFRGYWPLFVPPGLTTALLVLWPLRRAIPATARLIGGRESVNVSAAAALVVVMMAITLIALPATPVYDEQLELPTWLRWLRPQYDIYRVLLLAPLWGAWAMLIAGQFCKPNDKTEPQVAAMFRGCGAFTTAAVMGALAAATMFYCPTREWTQWTQLSIPGVTIIAAIAAGAIICRATKGVRRDGLLCANVLVQIVFMLAYLANRYR